MAKEDKTSVNCRFYGQLIILGHIYEPHGNDQGRVLLSKGSTTHRFSAKAGIPVKAGQGIKGGEKEAFTPN